MVGVGGCHNGEDKESPIKSQRPLNFCQFSEIPTPGKGSPDLGSNWEMVSSEAPGSFHSLLLPSYHLLLPPAPSFLLEFREDPTKMSKQAALSRVIWSAMVRPVKPGRRLANSTILIMHLVASSLNLSQRPKSNRTRWSALEF